VRWIVGFAPGGATDIIARLMGRWLSERLGQPFVIENRPGAGTNIATEAVVRAPADGYTLLLVGPTHATNAALYEKLNFNFARDIAPIASISRDPNVMVVNPLLPARSVPEFIAYAKVHPGEINMASSGNGTSVHLAGELFKMMTGINMLHVPYRGAGPAIADLIGGQVQVMFASMLSSIGYLRSGNLRALAVTTATRSEQLPEVPTLGDFVQRTRRADSLASVRPNTHPLRSSRSSMEKSMLRSSIRKSRRSLRNWAARCFRARQPSSAS
jgi:tripartite-type tricarboxylate transporter receptor subunit TctC